jgi:hypothetical protein
MKMTGERRHHKARWVEGLDWMRVEDILDPDVGGSRELYTTLLKTLFNRLPDVDMELDELIRTEGARRIQAGEMTYEQAMCFVEALRLSNEETGKLIAEMEKILKRSKLRVVK